ncbi:hypothetical protein ARMSODRAFT_1016761 [Armillaria solidipes]|uniref:CCHC-type domain-containing protein n=1 Tax=Armillaria solidipes TaxID=1076256 RepID=A0A2H3C6M4_9AGAR|nr:hypothetical protein ARMSODRAFT_1016761 [Armillaria solidipes]
MELAERKVRHIEELRLEMEDAERAHDAHVQFWNLPVQNKGKAPDHSQPSGPPIPEWQKLLHERTNRHYAKDAPHLSIKPMLLAPPKPFKGDHNDIECFTGNCAAYFETFTSYFQLCSQMVPFTASHFEGSAKDWWVHKQQEFWSSTDWDPILLRYQYPERDEFLTLLNAQFRDPTVEEVHKKRMFDLWMGNGAANSYFQELEKEAKLAGQRYDEGERGMMVKAVRLGIPELYSKFIAMTSFNMPHTYQEWKARVLVMYEERQKKWVFDQTTGTSCDMRPPHKGPSTTATSNKAGSMTSSSLAKPMSSATPWEPGTGRWQPVRTTTYGRAGEPMDIGKLHTEGRCFWCHKKGHLGKDCPKKQDYKDICSVQMVPEQEKTELKVEEVKE